MNKHKMKQSSKKKGYYAAQFHRTEINKRSVAKRRQRRAALWK